MTTTSYDKIQTSTPVSRADAPRSGAHWSAPVTEGQVHAHAPPPMRRVPGNVPPENNLTARVFGRLTVVGLAKNKNSAGRALWVVRCVCSTYEQRTARALTQGKSDRCAHCHKVEYFREGRNSIGCRHDT